jgi:hypothetical protein
MNVKACDLCLTEKKIVLATRRIGFRHGASANVCERHRENVKSLDQNALHTLAMNAGISLNAMLDAALGRKRRV